MSRKVPKYIMELVLRAYEEKRNNRNHKIVCDEIGISYSKISKIRNNTQKSISKDDIYKIINKTSYEEDVLINSYLLGNDENDENNEILLDEYKTEYISLDRLLLVPGNPRISREEDESKITLDNIKDMQQSVGDKLSKISNNTALSKSLKENGIIYGKNAYVVFLEEGYYIVWEGNRRTYLLKKLYEEFKKKNIPELYELFKRFRKDKNGVPMIPVYVLDGNYKDDETRKKISILMALMHASDSEAPWNPAGKARGLCDAIDAGRDINKLSNKEKQLVYIAKAIENIKGVIEYNLLKTEGYIDYEVYDHNDENNKTVYSDDNDNFYTFYFNEDDSKYSAFIEATGKKKIVEWLGYNKKNGTFENKKSFFDFCLWIGIIECESTFNGIESNFKGIIKDARGELRDLEKALNNYKYPEEIMESIREYYWENANYGGNILSVDIVASNAMKKSTMTYDNGIKKIVSDIQQLTDVKMTIEEMKDVKNNETIISSIEFIESWLIQFKSWMSE